MTRTAQTLTVGMLATLLATACGVEGTSTSSDTYGNCSSTADCGSSFDTCTSVSSFRESRLICTHACTGDTDCEHGGLCVDETGDGRLCLQRCTSRGTTEGCELDFSCQALATRIENACLPAASGSDSYESCNDHDDCRQPFDACTSVSSSTDTRLLCTHSCTADHDCAYDGVCADFAGTGTFCLQRCSALGTSGGCELGFTCQTLATAGASACLPGT